jgi:hypothetical protein
MSIALIGGWTFVHPIDERVRLNPSLTNGGFGMGVTVSPDAVGGDRSASRTEHEPRWRYTWEVGRITVRLNTAQAPDGQGDAVDFRFRERNNPMVTSNLRIDRRLGERHQLTARLAPFEVREEEHYPQPVTFGGVTFGPEVLDTRYVGYDLRLRWRRRLTPDGWFAVHAGAGLEIVATRAELRYQSPPSRQPEQVGRADDLGLYPVLHLGIGITPGPCRFYAEADGSRLGSTGTSTWPSAWISI